MKKKIEKPKVFISYAWSNEDYQQKVLAFAIQLVGDGIDVVLDKWNLAEGNDMYAFMERCVTDPSITNVLMLLDPLYAKKADDHVGGVGTETQIISAEVYQEVTQDRFIPIVMERDVNGDVCKPAYLQTRLHFDLSIPSEYSSTYQRLVKTLYGEEIYEKPPLGSKPDWVEKSTVNNLETIIRYDSLKYLKDKKIKDAQFEEYLKEIKARLIEYSKKSFQNKWKQEEYISHYDGTSDIKEDFLLLMKNSVYLEDSYKKVAVFFEETKNELYLNRNTSGEVISVRIHELFLYAVAYYLKNKDYHAVGYLLEKTYFDQRNYRDNHGANSFVMFYSNSDRQNLDTAIKLRDGKEYYTGTGHHWINTLSSDFCSKGQFIFADLICFNYSIYGKNFISDWQWFPLTYVYDDGISSGFNVFCSKMVSREYIQEILPLFGFDTIEDLAIKIKSVEEAPPGTYRGYRYGTAFDSAHMFKDFIKAKDLASFR